MNDELKNQDALEELAWTLDASQGEFRLILARCNYIRLRSRLFKQVQQLTDANIRILNLKKSDKSLYTKIASHLHHTPQAMMICGLESLQDLDKLLIATNQIREEFRKKFLFPIVLWVTDEVLAKLARLASDFESWATTIEFTITADELIETLQHDTDAIFAIALASDKYSIGWQMGYLRRAEIVRFSQDLQLHHQEIEAEIQASIYFVYGQDAYLNNKINIALDYYQRSLSFWWQKTECEELNQDIRETAFKNHQQLFLKSSKLRTGVVLFYIGLCYFQKAESCAASRDYLLQAKYYFQECIYTFTTTNHPNLIAKFINPLGEVLRRLEAWDELYCLAQQILDLQKLYTNSIRVARAYGFLAEVAIGKKLWLQAKQNIYQALHHNNKNPTNKQQHRGLYLLLLAEAELNLGHLERAEKYLQQARDSGNQKNPYQYIRILQQLHFLYWQKSHFLEAFHAKLEIRSLEQQYGLRAFVGAGKIQPLRKAQSNLTQIVETIDNTLLQETIAPEITASGRQKDIENLVNRITRHDYKLTVIHGYSGVGKTSLVQAGLVPALKQRSMSLHENVPVLLEIYTNWVSKLGEALKVALAKTQIWQDKYKTVTSTLAHSPLLSASLKSSDIIKTLNKCNYNNLKVILIFDQFEEFINNTNYQQRQDFLNFLGECLNILGVKVILSLRQDYLHYLLESNSIPSIGIINHDILSKNILYQIGNFTPDNAKSLIAILSERSNFQIEPDLIEQLVQDLSVKFGEVRPIELQIVGAQLQTENITTLAQYKKHGTHKELVKRYLEEVVQDCGSANQQIAEILLYLLTDEKGIRPIKTKSELASELKLLALDTDDKETKGNENSLDLVLQIFVASGIVVLIPGNPNNGYQLVHDYLAAFIQSQQPKLNELIIKLNQERKQANINRNKLKNIYQLVIIMVFAAILGLIIAILK